MTETTTLSRRDLGFSPTALSANEFVNMIMHDIADAKEAYLEISTRDAEAAYERDKKNYIERRNKAINKIMEESFVKYKREYYRQQWLKKELAKWPAKLERSHWHNPDHLTYIDWSMKPWEMGTKSVSLVRNTEEEIKEFFRNRFKEDFDNKYFSQCMGWEIVVNQRPYFRLILSPELQAEWNADEKRLSDSVTRFYSGSNYWGD